MGNRCRGDRRPRQGIDASIVVEAAPGFAAQQSGRQALRGQRRRPEARLLMSIYDGLTEYDPKTLAPIPAIAETWDNNADFTEFTFHLRKNARFSNGDAITARVDPRSPARVGGRLRLAVDPQRFHYFDAETGNRLAHAGAAELVGTGA